MRKSELPLGEFHFVDAGCGAGIAGLYAGDNYPFASIGGFDLNPSLIDAARTNASRLPPRAPARFWVGDAKTEQLLSHRTCLFLFNPFGAQTARALLTNNIGVLRQSRSIACLANDRLLPTFLDFGRLLHRDAQWNLSVVAFG